MKLSALDLRKVADFLDGLTEATVETDVVAGADTAMSVKLPHWAHSLDVGGYTDDDGYSLAVGSEY